MRRNYICALPTSACGGIPPRRCKDLPICPPLLQPYDRFLVLVSMNLSLSFLPWKRSIGRYSRGFERKSASKLEKTTSWCNDTMRLDFFVPSPTPFGLKKEKGGIQHEDFPGGHPS